MTTEELKPCPFCGGRELEIGALGVECNECDAVGPSGKDGLDMLSTIAAWNRRVAEADAAGSRRWVSVLPVQEPTQACAHCGSAGMHYSNCGRFLVEHTHGRKYGSANTVIRRYNPDLSADSSYLTGKCSDLSEAITPKEPPPTRAYMKDGMRILGVVCQQCGNEETISDARIVEPAHEAALAEVKVLREALEKIRGGGVPSGVDANVHERMLAMCALATGALYTKKPTP